MGTSDGVNPSEIIEKAKADLESWKSSLQNAELGSNEESKKFYKKNYNEALEKYNNAIAKYGAAAKKQQTVSTVKNIGGKGLKTIGKGLKGVGTGAAVALGAIGGAALSGLRNAGRAIGGSGDSSGSSSDTPEVSGIKLIFIISAFIQFVDILSGSSRPGFILSAYVVLMIMSVIFVFKRDRADEAGLLVAIVAAYFLPMFTKSSFMVSLASTSNLMLLLQGLIVLIPIVPLYIAFKFPDHTAIKTLATWVVAFWVIVFALFAIVTYMPDQNTKVMINNPMEGVKYVFASVGKIFDKAFSSVSTTFKRAVAQATGQPYDGQEESQVGIYVEDIRSLESKYDTNSEVYVEAKIKAVNVKEKVNINTICWIEGVTQGTVSPTLMEGVDGNYENIAMCNLGHLKEGNYEVKVRADFEFETTSDIEYTFVSSDIKSDQYAKLNINPQTIATYTGGPVDLGLPSLTQPLRIKLNEKTNTLLSTYPFGVSLKNNWPQGKVLRGLRYVLDTPKEVKLVECSRDPVATQEPDELTDRNKYTFEINTSNAQEVFDAVRCRMQLDNVRDLLGNDLKSVKTFAARARYQYAVEGTTQIIVEKSLDDWTEQPVN